MAIPRAVWIVMLIALAALGGAFFWIGGMADPAAAPHPQAAQPRRALVLPAPRVGIIIDDFGENLNNVEGYLSLPTEVAFAVIPGLPRSQTVARMAYDKGFEVFLHQPMEPESFPADNPGPRGIYLKQSDEEIVQLLLENIMSLGVPLTGVNNHMGSRATEDKRVMNAVFSKFPETLIFLDSRTSQKSVAYSVSVQHGIRSLRNNIFLDADPSAESVQQAFDRTVAMAKRNGMAVGLGHVHYSTTLDALKRGLGTLEERGVTLMRLSDMVGMPSVP